MMDRFREIVDLVKGGMRPGIVAKELGVPASTVYSYIQRARNRGEDIPKAKTGPIHYKPFAAVRVDPKAIARLDGAARKRGVTTRELAATIIERVAHDGMVDAVLDDGGDVYG